VTRLFAAIGAGLLIFGSGVAPLNAADSSSLRTVQGTVLDVGSQPGEGALQLVTARLALDGGQGQELELLLAPSAVLDEIGFAVEPGDRIKARVFAAESGPSKVHKARNLSRRSMTRLRTLRQTPLWDGSGHWMGAPGMGGDHGWPGMEGGMEGGGMGDHGGGGRSPRTPSGHGGSM